MFGPIGQTNAPSALKNRGSSVSTRAMPSPAGPLVCNTGRAQDAVAPSAQRAASCSVHAPGRVARVRAANAAGPQGWTSSRSPRSQLRIGWSWKPAVTRGAPCAGLAVRARLNASGSHGSTGQGSGRTRTCQRVRVATSAAARSVMIRRCRRLRRPEMAFSRRPSSDTRPPEAVLQKTSPARRISANWPAFHVAPWPCGASAVSPSMVSETAERPGGSGPGKGRCHQRPCRSATQTAQPRSGGASAVMVRVASSRAAPPAWSMPIRVDSGACSCTSTAASTAQHSRGRKVRIAR